MTEHILCKENSENNVNENINEFSYSKIFDEAEAIADYLEQLTEEVINMRVECAVTNIELVSKIDSIDFERKIAEAEEIYESSRKSLPNSETAQQK